MMPRFYVTLTWDDYPEGGSYGTVVEAVDHAGAEIWARLEMAQLRVSDRRDEYHIDDDIAAEIIEESQNDDWHLVDCFDLDGFIKMHTPVEGEVIDA